MTRSPFSYLKIATLQGLTPRAKVRTDRRCDKSLITRASGRPHHSCLRATSILSYPIRNTIMIILSGYNIHKVTRVLRLPMTLREVSKFMNPVRYIFPNVSATRRLISSGNTIIIIGKDVQDVQALIYRLSKIFNPEFGVGRWSKLMIAIMVVDTVSGRMANQIDYVDMLGFTPTEFEPSSWDIFESWIDCSVVILFGHRSWTSADHEYMLVVAKRSSLLDSMRVYCIIIKLRGYQYNELHSGKFDKVIIHPFLLARNLPVSQVPLKPLFPVEAFPSPLEGWLLRESAI